MSTLEDIIAHGNRGAQKGQFKSNNRITCADGFSLSVIAGAGTYCSPRPDLFAENWDGPLVDPIGMYEVGGAYPGPYSAVEVGYPSERPEPWRCTAWNDGYDRHDEHEKCDGWAVFADGIGDTDDHATVYGYVPVDVVRALVASHGGEAESAA